MSGSQGERRIIVPAAGVVPVRVPGDFIFIKFADRPVVVRIAGQAIVMRAGDRRKIERSAGNPRAPAFDIFELENPSPDAPLAVEFVAGEGDYSSQIINGEVIVAPGIRRADGRWYDDTRRDLSLRLALSSIEAVEHLRYDRELYYSAGARAGNGTPWGVIGDGPGRVIASWQGSYISVWDIYAGTREPLSWYPVSGYSCPVYVNGAYYVFSSGVHSLLGSRVLRLHRFGALTAEAWAARSTIETTIEVRASSYSIRPDGNGQLIYSGGYLYAAIYLPDGSGALVKLDISGNLYAARAISGWWMLGEHNGVIHKSGSGGGADEWEAAYSGEDLSNAPITLPDGDQLGQYVLAIGMLGPRHLLGVGIWDGGPSLRKYAAQAWTDYASGSVASCNGAGMFDAKAAPTDAQLTLMRDESGRPVASGQVIKAALDIYLGEAGGYVAPDYLDHIYGVQFEYANYRRPLSIQTGGSSFLRSGIADDFKNVPLPQRIIITADADLASEVEQWNS